MKKLIVIIITILTITTTSIITVLGAQEFEYTPGSKIRAKISANNINRIEFGKVGIAQIIGDETKYKIVTDDKAQNIFLLPKLEDSETLELALINFSGNVADLVLEPEDNIEGQIIKISMDSFYNGLLQSKYHSSSLFSNNHVDPNTIQEIAKMMKIMILDKEDKYYVIRIKRKISPSNIHLKPNNNDITNTLARLSVEQDRIYRFGHLIGARLVVTNKTTSSMSLGQSISMLLSKKSSNQIPKGTVYLGEMDFSNIFDSCLAVAIENPALLHKEKSFVWIITEENS